MASPHDLYIRFLITKGIDTLSDINDVLESLHLPLTNVEDIEKQTRFTEELLPAGILKQIDTKYYSIDFMKWMRHLDIHELWEPFHMWEDMYPDSKKIADMVMDIHEDRRLRLTINGLLMKGMGAVDIFPLLAGKFSTSLREDELEVYKKYFFEPARMKRRDWKSYLEGVDPLEKKIYFTALSQDIEAVKTELGLAARLNTSDSLQFLLSQSFHKAKKFLDMNSVNASKEARAWINTFTSTVDKYEKYKASDTSDLSKALQLEFDYIDTEFPVPDNETLESLNEQVRKQETEDPDLDGAQDESIDEEGTLFEQ